MGATCELALSLSLPIPRLYFHHLYKASGVQGAEVSGSLEEALQMLAGPAHAGRVERVFVIGGGQVYAEALGSPLCTAVHLTQARSCCMQAGA